MFFYNLTIYLFQIGIKLASFFNPKAMLWVNGRVNWQEKLKKQVASKKLNGAIWIHCASLGEFEQGRPVIEAIRNEFPNQKIVLSFFSPSGYQIQKNFPLVNYVCYLPADTKQNAKDFIEIINPKIAIFVKYEFWLNYLFELSAKNINTFLISTVIKKHQSFFKWYGGNFRKALQTYHTIFTQDTESLKLLKTLHVDTGQLAGDTRFDRVLEISVAPKHIEEIHDFCKDSFVIIAGSSWQKDEEYLIEAYLNLKQKYKNIKLIIAPHEIDKQNINRLQNLLYKHHLQFNLFTQASTHYDSQILILNTMGMLSFIYQYGTIAYVGGGFNNGIHNILEPSVFCLPILVGPNHEKFNEADEMISLNAAFQINNASDLENQIGQFLEDENYLRNTASLTKNYIVKKTGATQKIMSVLKNHLKSSVI